MPYASSVPIAFEIYLYLHVKALIGRKPGKRKAENHPKHGEWRAGSQKYSVYVEAVGCAYKGLYF